MRIQVIASGSSGNCYRVYNDDSSLLIEAGISFNKIQEAINFRTSDLDGVIISHEHGDHSKAVKRLLDRGIDVYMTKGTRKALKLDLAYNLLEIRLSNPGSYRSFEMGSFEIFPFEAVHDAAEPVSFYVRDTKTGDNLGFITDSAYAKFLLPNLTHLMIEINYVKEVLDRNLDQGYIDLYRRNRIVKNHMSLETALELLEANDLSRLREVYVMHLSDANSDEAMIREAIQRATGVAVTIC